MLRCFEFRYMEESGRNKDHFWLTQQRHSICLWEVSPGWRDTLANCYVFVTFISLT